MSTPWLKFYPSDWRADPALRMCSLAARGLWMEMLCLMHEATPRGHLLVNGRAITSAQLASLVGMDAGSVDVLLSELEQAGVFSRKKNDVIFSRRMEKDENKSRKSRENGKMGGNPSLCKETEIEASLNPRDNTQKPEARNQKPEKEKIPKEPRQAEPDAVLDEFSRIFWPAYPRKDAKPAALKAFRKARQRVELEPMMEGLHRYKAGISDPKYTCQPATWLNNDRWADEPAPQIFQPSPNQLPFASNRQERRNGNRIIDSLHRIGARLEDLDSGCIPPARSSFAN